MISENKKKKQQQQQQKMMKSYSVFHIEQKMEFEKFNYFFIDFLKYIFGRIKVISTLVERDYKPDKNWQIIFVYQLTDFYMLRDLNKRYFLTVYSYILEYQFYFGNVREYCFNPSLSRIFWVKSSVKVLSSQWEGPSTRIFPTLLLCTFVTKFFSKYFLGQN